MHATALELGRRFFETYGDSSRDEHILDVGSMDVNGSLRSVASPSDHYTGVDLEAGPGVDIVIENTRQLPFDPGHFDLVVSSSAMEHDMLFWQTFAEMMRVLVPGGYLYLNVPSNGKYHAHPFDCWRFYPDSGIALEAWAQELGIACRLMESFTYDQGPEEWNDAVLVFCKSRLDQGTYPTPMGLDDPKARNLRWHGAWGMEHIVDATEDQRRYRQAKRTNEHLWAGRRDDDATRTEEGAPFFSVIVAYYQGCTSDTAFERFLESLDAQTFRDFEVLIYHDGPLLEPVVCPYSIVATPERTAQWGHDLRAMALCKAKGTYVLHTNADNQYAPEAFAGLADVLYRQPMDVCVGEVDMMGLIRDENGVLHYDSPRDYDKSVRFTGVPPVFQNVDLMQVAIRRSVWLHYGFVGRDAGADGRLIERIAIERGYGRVPVLVGRHF